MQNYTWNFTSLLDANSKLVVDPNETALLVLNYKIRFAFDHICNQVRFIFCADGGANRFYDSMKKYSPYKFEEYFPKFICGDMDSAREEVKEFYKKKDLRLYSIMTKMKMIYTSVYKSFHNST